MTKRPIRDMHSSRPTAPRFCDVVIENGQVFLEKKSDKNKYEKIRWEDVVYQVDIAITADREGNYRN